MLASLHSNKGGSTDTYIFKEHECRPRFTNVLGSISTYIIDNPETLTPSLCTIFAITPFCGDLITVSIFMLSILSNICQRLLVRFKYMCTVTHTTRA
jgi:hypothetical protein